MPWYRWLPVLLIGLSSLLVTAADLATEVTKRLDPAPVLRGDFEQRKTVGGFKQPLLSRGDFLLWRDHGVLWQTRKPFAASLVLTRKTLLARQADGSAAYRLDSRAQPALAAVNELLFALLGGDIATLAKRFRIEGELQGKEGWQLQLTPLDDGLARVFQRVRLRGDRYVRQVDLEEANGDSSQIRFEQLRQAPRPPTPR
ncbi:outer membrane lipoprotein carrier protein LolA [Chitinimonas arctica]|uniref:Outer membrane lipoprotein carrier protein LolA n=2 Tax=Chitinimonas arctica TaxID=2594795 RepID=A0A516SMI9_9NEIS|nr:outer membrane lipoprotein carrier protein LolA [Chitinimonas arctica]